MLPTDSKSISALFGDVVDQLGHLVVTEVRLAQAELSKKIDEAGRGAALLVVAGVLMIPAVAMVLLALATWLSQMGISEPLSYLISAVVGGALSAAFLVTGLGRLNPKRLKLKNTMQQLSQDVAAARNLAK
ncbi:MAG: phage holin family protein [Alphaproteobacteria bacterium]|nr:phage holin family protein [Alphaproteobacteria bacterium]